MTCEVESLTALQLAAVGDFTVVAGCLSLSTRVLGQLGWTCRIKRNRFGGRHRITFHSADGRSVLAFKGDAGAWLPVEQILSSLSGGVLKSENRPIKYWSDDELLAALLHNKKMRAASRPRKKFDRDKIAKVMEAA
jgi:hypothetical protein